MTTINTVNDRQTHDALYRLEGSRAVIRVTSPGAGPLGLRLAGRILGSAWRDPAKRGLSFSVDGEPGHRLIPYGEIESITLGLAS